MLLDLAIADKVKQLRREGLRPSEKLAAQIVRTGDAAVGPLLELATDLDLLHGDAPECFAPIHALRLLGEVGSTAIIEPLLREFPVGLEYEDERLPRVWAEEAPQIIGHFGVPAVAPLWAIADDATGWAPAARNSAMMALVYVTAVAPDTHDLIVAGLRERLAAAEDRADAGYLASALANLGVKELYPEILALYRAGKIDPEILPAGAARQLLLSDSTRRLACAKHPLWERYDQHGPFANDE